MSAKIHPVAGPQEVPNEALLTASGVQCYRGDRLLFSDLNLELSAGEALQVHGANGSGKTTLLRILCGLTLPTEGDIRWRGQSITASSRDFFSECLYVGHMDGVKLELTPVENLRFARALGGEPSDEPLEELLGRVELAGFEDVPARKLSAGQRRRVALARLLATKATLWLLDEPFTSLDKTGTGVMESFLDTHLARGGSALFSSHHPVRITSCATRELHLFP